MVENKIDLGSFLVRNAEECSKASFHGLVENQETLHRIIEAGHSKGRNCALLVRCDEPEGEPQQQLQLVHSLLMTERDTRKRVVGFLGYSDFESPIEIAYKLMTGRNQVIRKLDHQKEGTDLPTYSELVHEASVESFMVAFSYDTLSPAALDRAKKIPQALLVENSVLALLPMDRNQSAMELLQFIVDTTPVIPESDLIDGLVLFLWATAKGLNSTVPSFSPKAWSKDALKEFAYLKATFQGDAPSDGEDGAKSPDSSEGEDESVNSQTKAIADLRGEERNGVGNSYRTPIRKSNSDRARTTGAATAGARTAGGGDSGERTVGGGGSGTPTNRNGANVSGSTRPRQSSDPGDPNDPDSEEDSQCSELSLRGKSAARKRNRKKRKKRMQAASASASGSPVISDPMELGMHLEMLNASVRSMAAATVDQSKDNKVRLDTDTLKKSLVKNLTEEQQLLMRVVLGGDFASATPQAIDQFRMPENAQELLRHSNLKLFET
ncbi:hypothetical protein FRACYDRAFT_258688, partial [Fragilariopsis cylindrus CCMP1102]